MKKIAIQALCACLYTSILASCGAQRALHFARHTSLDSGTNSIKVDGQPVFKVSTSALDLKDVELALSTEALPRDRVPYVSSILKEAHSSEDTIIAVCPTFILLKTSEVDRKPDVDYLYQLNFESGRWICSYISATTDGSPELGDACAFLRKIYVVERRNRVIVKDYFGDIAIVHVIQGQDSKAPFFVTSIWRPADFSAMMTMAYYIQREIDPISHAVATGRYVK